MKQDFETNPVGTMAELEALRALLAPPSVLGMPEGCPTETYYDVKNRANYGLGNPNTPSHAILLEYMPAGSRDRLRELEAALTELLEATTTAIPFEDGEEASKAWAARIEAAIVRARALSKEKQP